MFLTDTSSSLQIQKCSTHTISLPFRYGIVIKLLRAVIYSIPHSRHTLPTISIVHRPRTNQWLVNLYFTHIPLFYFSFAATTMPFADRGVFPSPLIYIILFLYSCHFRLVSSFLLTNGSSLTFKINIFRQFQPAVVLMAFRVPICHGVLGIFSNQRNMLIDFNPCSVRQLRYSRVTLLSFA